MYSPCLLAWAKCDSVSRSGSWKQMSRQCVFLMAKILKPISLSSCNQSNNHIISISVFTSVSNTAVMIPKEQCCNTDKAFNY